MHPTGQGLGGGTRVESCLRGSLFHSEKSCRQLRLRNEAIQPSLRGWTEFILANCVMPLNKHLGDEENCEGLGGRALGGRVF